MEVMNTENYVSNVIRTDTPITPELIERISNPRTIRLLHCAMGLCTESGEFMDMLKRHVFYGKPIDEVNAKEELGDTCWYVGLGIDALETTLMEILSRNIHKLKGRYPDKFNEEDAINRDLENERKLLESPEIFTQPPSTRGSNWLVFAEEVFRHIETYTIPQYGDKGNDQVTEYSAEDCVLAIRKYVARFGKNSREGQQRLDLIKIAHYAQLALEKLEESEN